MIIAGGTYLETCLTPGWRRLFGSGCRAAAALGWLSPGSHLHTYAFSGWQRDVQASMNAHGVAATITPITDEIGFSYFHPLSRAELAPSWPTMNAPLSVEGAAVLRFGFIEGDAVVRAGRAVYDPQGGDLAPFRRNGSRAEALAIVLNEAEAEAIAGVSGPQAAELICSRQEADVVVVKRGCSGARIHRPDRSAVQIPAYISTKIFKIGSGDVFSAAFAHHWAEKSLDAVEAADIASRAVARYVESRSLPLEPEASDDPVPTVGEPGRIYLAGPFFDIAQRWLIEEARSRLIELGAEVFSPLHDVGTVGASRDIATADLDGLDACDAVLALVDSADLGTIFEVGHARARGIPVVALAERLGEENLTMLSGTGCSITTDLASALYHAVWASMR